MPVDPTIRLRLATRIHFALLRHYDENVSVSTLLKGEDDAREALWVCAASGHEDLVTLGRQFESMPVAPALGNQTTDAATKTQPGFQRTATPRTAHVHAPQDAAWSFDTTGFGVSRPFELADATNAPAPLNPKPAHWLSPSSWLRRINAG